MRPPRSLPAATPEDASERLDRRRLAASGGIALGVLYSWLASGSTSFTVRAAALASIPIVTVGAMTFIPTIHRITARTVQAQGVMPAVPGRRLLGWAIVIALAFLWEVREVVAHSRFDYPTISSIVDSLFRRSRGLKAGLFFLWLFGGWSLATGRRGRAVRALRQPEVAPEAAA